MAGNGRTAVVGLGSPIMCDDAVGLRVSRAIDAMGFDDVDGFEEAVGGRDVLPLIEGYTRAIIVDAIMTGEHGPGTVMIFEESYFDEVLAEAATHDVNLPSAIKIGRKMEGDVMPDEIMFVAIEVQDISTMSETMTPEVEASVGSATGAVLHLLGRE